MKSTTFFRCAAGAALLAIALPAAAHPGHGTGFLAGLAHPFTGIDHMLALLAVGLLSRQGRHSYLLAPAFLAMAAFGAAVCGAVPLAGAALEMAIAAGVLLLGVLAAGAVPLPAALALPVVAACAFVHGLAHGRELAGTASGAGFLVASAALIALGAVPGTRARRVAGAAIGVAGCWLLVLAG
jgi:urease accessory protein